MKVYKVKFEMAIEAIDQEHAETFAEYITQRHLRRKAKVTKVFEWPENMSENWPIFNLSS